MRIPRGKASIRVGALALVLAASTVLVTAVSASAATVTSFTPTCGPVGTVVTITGTGFTGADGVVFNGTHAATWAVINDTTATATVPTGAITGYILVSTPGSDVSSNTSFTVTPGPCGGGSGAHERSITLLLKNHLTAKGRLTVKDGFNACRSDAKVKIQRLVSGSWKTVGTDTTTGVGNYRVNVPDKPGKYRATVAKRGLNGGDDVCAAVTSAPARHHH